MHPRTMSGAAARALAVALALAFVLTAGVGAAHAAPANTKLVKTFQQPDGSSIQLRLWGDEFAHGYETLDGYTVLYDERDRAFEFAERGPDGSLRPSGRLAGPGRTAGQPRRLRPTNAAVDAQRRAAGMLQQNQLSMNMAAPPWAGGDTDVLFLAVEFANVGCSFTPGNHDTNLFGGGATGPGDLDDYFDEISYGALDFQGDVVGSEDGTDCITLSENRAHYNTGTTDGDDDLVREALAIADDYVDFSQYDNDGDGFIDALGIIYAGGGPHDGCVVGTNNDNLWPHSGRINTGGPPPIVDSKVAFRFIINSELTYSVDDEDNCDQIQTIGLFAHEFGHSLGLPDLYDTGVGWGGVDTWSAMASQYASTTNLADTPPHYDPWSKAVLGWVTPAEHDAADLFEESLEQVETSGEVHQFLDNPLGFQTDPGSGEFFLVENRQKVGFDAQLAGCGVLVWHIDEGQPDNETDFHRLVDLEQADGQFDLNDNNDADDGDPFPGSTNNASFNDTTTPDSKLFGGTSSNVQMRVKSAACGSSMSALFGPNSPPVAEAGGPYTTQEGTEPELDGTGSYDPDGDTITYAWEWDGGSNDFDDATGATPSYPLVGDDVSEKVIGLKVTDEYDQSDIDAAQVTVTNVAPSVLGLSSNAPRPEGSTVHVTATISDPGWEDDLTATIDWGDGAGPQPIGGDAEDDAPNATLEIDAQHAYGDNGLYTVTVCGRDDDGGESCVPTLVDVTNVAPTIDGVSDAQAKLENQTATVTATVSDPGWLDHLTATVDWGDGAGPQAVTGEQENDAPEATLTLTADHLYGDNGTFTVTFCAKDDDGGAAPCEATEVVVDNVKPTAEIDETNAVDVNGVKTLFAKAGDQLALSGRMTDPGSDDLTATWSWDDGSPDTATTHRNDPLFPDPLPSPSVNPRDVMDAASHAFAACLYDVGFRAGDDDGDSSPTDTIKVLITGTTDGGRQSGYWAHQYRRNGARQFDDARLTCYLEIAAFVSRVFHEARDASTLDRAQAVLFSQGAPVSERDQLDRDLLTAWLNLANGAVGWGEPVDTNGDGAVDTPFHQAMKAAEDVRLDATATTTQINAQRTIVQRINDTI